MDQNQQLQLSEIKRRIVTSFLSLTARQIALRALSFVTLNIVLARVLSVETLGIFNIATAIVTFFAFFSDIGLAASIIQKKDDVSEEDIATVFTIQQILVGILSLLIIFLAPVFGAQYHLDNDAVWLVRVLGFCFFLTSLKVIPSVLLERQLKFRPLVSVELVETVLFNLGLILLVFSGFGVWSFSIATVIRTVSGVLMIYLISPVRLKIGIYKLNAKRLLSFGVFYQINNLLALLKDRLVPLVIAGMVGPIGVGYITWSQSLALLPLEVMNIIIRITFPAFSRLQHDRESLTAAIEKSLFVTSLLVYPVIFGIGAILPSLVNYVVSNKWQPAIISFYFFAVAAYWAVISTTFTNLLNAIGQIRTTLKLMVMWTILTWIVTPMLTLSYGFLGVGIASFLISFSSIVAILMVKKEIKVRVLDSISTPTLGSVGMAIVVYFYSQYFVRSSYSLIGAIILGGFVYSVVLLVIDKDRVFKYLRDIKNLRNA